MFSDRMNACAWAAATLLFSGTLVLAQTATTGEAQGGQAQAEGRARADGQADGQPQGEARADGRVWLGLQVAPVPAVVSSQLKLPPGDGSVVVNVATDSPADNAGVAQHDVILKVDGRATRFAGPTMQELLADAKPGDVAKLTLVREGKQQVADVKLAPPVAAGQVQWKHAVAPQQVEDFAVEHGPQLLPRMLRRNADGWEMQELPAELPDDVARQLRETMEQVRQMQRQMQDQVQNQAQLDLQQQGEPGGHAATRSVTSATVIRNGEKIQVNSEDGRYVVKRSDANGGGEAQSKTYGSLEQLRKEDPEAFALIQRAGGGVRIVAPHVHVQMDGGQPRVLIDVEEAPAGGNVQVQAQALSFSTGPDGRIHVKGQVDGRKIDAVFDNEADFRAKEPKLFEQYKRMRMHLPGQPEASEPEADAV